MTALFVVLFVVTVVLVDFGVRAYLKWREDQRIHREREEVLKTAVRLDFTHEAKSLTRVEVPEPKARILAVDDEPVVLDSFRKILVLDGFSVDTVETGPEALGLVQRRDYDFVFTDLKMPVMDGVEVVKAVKHLRPDVDVAVITGYGTIETAVETMQHGAVAYVQKPFTAQELSEFARKLLIKRQARLEAQRRPTVKIVSPVMAEAAADHEYCVPGGAFVSPGHTWARIEPGGQVRVGIDDFARKAIGPIGEVTVPERGVDIHRGSALFAVKRGVRTVHFTAPMSGKILAVNEALEHDPARLAQSPYDRGWVCILQPVDLAGELRTMRIGRPVADWYQEEIARLRASAELGADPSEPVDWTLLEREFFVPAVAEVAKS